MNNAQIGLRYRAIVAVAGAVMLVALISTTGALAQKFATFNKLVNDLGNFDGTNAGGLSFSSDKFVLEREADRALLTGSPKITMSETEIRGETIEIIFRVIDGKRDVSRVNVSGGAVVQNGDEMIRSTDMVYDVDGASLLAVGRVVVRSAETEFLAGRFNLNLDTGQIDLSGSGATGTAGRVSGSIDF